MSHRIYCAGPYSSNPIANTAIARQHALELTKRGHLAHCPHSATFGWEREGVDYERIMDLDLSILNYWATALFFIGPSPGADRELREANRLGLRIFYSLDDVPTLTESPAPEAIR